MARLTFQMSMIDVFVALSEGNPGALTVCMALFDNTEQIDPDAAMGSSANLFALDTRGIYGSRIWMLFKDVCGQDIYRMCALLRAVQLGLLPPKMLDEAIDNYGKGLEPEVIDDYCAAVKERLPNFQITNPEPV